MVDYSVFQQKGIHAGFSVDLPASKDYRVVVNGTEVPVYTCRISAYPFNTWWPGHQRTIDQSEIVSFVNLVSDEEIEVAVQPLTKTAYERIMVKPYHKKVAFERRGEQIVFTLKQNGGYVFALDDYHGMLYIFNNKPCPCEDPEKVTHYFGKGIHFPGKITLRSNESVYLDKDAYVYGCIFAENAENIRIYGNGIMDDGTEERVVPRCYGPYTNGNLKLYDCKNIRIQGVGFTNSAVWCVNLFHCFDAEVDGINVFGQWRYNNDGIDIVNSKNIVVKNCFVHSFDDAIVVKGIDRYSYENNTDMLIENCVVWCDWGRTLEIGLETECREYKNIIFRNCDILRAGNTACDIQNGDCATVHDIVFEDISIELEHFYTPEVLQSSEEQTYDQKEETMLAAVFQAANDRFRAAYVFEDTGCGDQSRFGEPDFAGIHNVKAKNLYVYADDGVLAKYGKGCVRLAAVNRIPTTEYRDITVENIFLNGTKLAKDEVIVNLIGCEEGTITVK